MARNEIATLPNAITGLRALGIPIFLYLYLGTENVVLAFIVLVLGALTDYFDGKVARALNQESKLGAALDPAIDRAYIAATVIALVITQIVPFWLLILLVGRDIWVGVLLIFKQFQGSGTFEVTFLGKAATFNLLYAFPFLLLSGSSGMGRVFYICGWCFVIWGCALYLITGAQYSYLTLRSEKKS